MAVFGVDTNSRGWAAVKLPAPGDSGPPEHGWMEAEGEENTRRIASCLSFCRFLTARACPGDWVVIEEPIHVQNGKTTRLLGMMAGALWAQTLTLDCVVVWANISTWKKQVVGKGSANKEQIRAWAGREMAAFGMVDTWEEASQVCPDLFDAYGIAKYGLETKILQGATP